MVQEFVRIGAVCSAITSFDRCIYNIHGLLNVLFLFFFCVRKKKYYFGIRKTLLKVTVVLIRSRWYDNFVLILVHLLGWPLPVRSLLFWTPAPENSCSDHCHWYVSFFIVQNKHIWILQTMVPCRNHLSWMDLISVASIVGDDDWITIWTDFVILPYESLPPVWLQWFAKDFLWTTRPLCSTCYSLW